MMFLSTDSSNTFFTGYSLSLVSLFNGISTFVDLLPKPPFRKTVVVLLNPERIRRFIPFPSALAQK